MARYNRDFLIPYLQNICALHIADKKLSDRCERLQNQAQRLRNGRDNPVPRKPEMEQLGCGAIGCFIMCGLMLVFAITGVVEDSGAMVWLSLLFTAIFGGIAGYSVYEVKRNNAITLAEYERKMDKHSEIFRRNKADLAKVPAVEQELNVCLREQNNVQVIMRSVYGANIIPSRYRNLYSAMYLYDWFSTGGSDDLDHALSMFVLEEIKDRLDQIIANQSDMILNQRIMIANQQRSIEHQKSYENMMRSKLNQIHATQEQQLGYMRMIESNTAVTAYFAAAEYIRRI